MAVISSIQFFIREYRLPLICFVLGVVFLLFGSLFPISTIFQSPKLASESVLADIEGEVHSPGLYKLRAGVTVGEAIRVAGGLNNQADVSFINQKMNLAEMVKDGQKILVPSKNRPIPISDSAAPGLIDINLATQSQLEALPGIGPVTATKILNGRPYGSVEDLLNRKLVSKSVFAKIRDAIVAQ